MKLYAICWQDRVEPWGWAPIDGKWDPVFGGERNNQPFHWDRAAAEQELARIVRETVESAPIPSWYTTANVRDMYRVVEYEVPEPPEVPAVGAKRIEGPMGDVSQARYAQYPIERGRCGTCQNHPDARCDLCGNGLGGRQGRDRL